MKKAFALFWLGSLALGIGIGTWPVSGAILAILTGIVVTMWAVVELVDPA